MHDSIIITMLCDVVYGVYNASNLNIISCIFGNFIQFILNKVYPNAALNGLYVVNVAVFL